MYTTYTMHSSPHFRIAISFALVSVCRLVNYLLCRCTQSSVSHLLLFHGVLLLFAPFSLSVLFSSCVQCVCIRFGAYACECLYIHCVVVAMHQQFPSELTSRVFFFFFFFFYYAFQLLADISTHT